MSDREADKIRICDERVERYAFEHSQPEPELLQALADETHRQMEMPQMLTGRIEGRLLKMLVQLTSARRVLEIGTFTGYSSLSMAEGLPDDGELITCEIDPDSRAFAQRYLDRSPHGKKVEIRLGPALETIARLDGPFDLVFMDADKENYPAYYDAVVPLLRDGGLLVIDNTLWSGAVLAPAADSDRAIDAVNRRALEDDRVENVLLTVRDGVHLVRKRPSS